MRLKAAISSQDHIQGLESAAVTLIEYGDYECPHCGHAYGVVKHLQRHFGDSLRFVFRNFPLTNVHPLAEPAAEAAEYAATQGKFWQMHDDIFENQSQLSTKLLLTLAQKNGLDTNVLKHVLEQGSFEERVKRDFMTGVRSGVNGTPTFFVNGQRHDGPTDFESLAGSITKAQQQ